MMSPIEIATGHYLQVSLRDKEFALESVRQHKIELYEDFPAEVIYKEIMLLAETISKERNIISQEMLNEDNRNMLLNEYFIPSDIVNNLMVDEDKISSYMISDFWQLQGELLDILIDEKLLKVIDYDATSKLIDKLKKKSIIEKVFGKKIIDRSVEEIDIIIENGKIDPVYKYMLKLK